jgi:phosphoribosyl 1,2-cyclic phosphodiesterase
MARSGLSLPRIKAVFISHEHSDHIRGVNTLAKKHAIPVYITAPTFRSGGLDIDPGQLRSFVNYEPVRLGTLSITAFPKLHDASDPCSFIISCGDTRVGVFTDIGFPCAHVIRNFSQCHAAFLEANYDTTMLTKGNYPYHLKKRISGGKGHLSNDQAFALFKHHRPSYMTHLFLSHLSAHNNDPAIVADLFQSYRHEMNIVVASRYEESPVYSINPAAIQPQILAKPAQLSLFA